MNRKSRSMKRHLYLVMPAVLSLAACFGSTASADLFVNGDFATAVPDNATGGDWTSFGLAGSAGWQAVGGGQVLLNNVGSGASDPGLHQNVSGLVIGQEYTLQWDYARHVGNSTNSFGVFIDTQSDPALLDLSNSLFIGRTTSSSFVTESVEFLATATSHDFFFAAELDPRTNGGGQTDTSFFIDNVSLTTAAVPEPSSLFVLGLAGFAGLTLRRRR